MTPLLQNIDITILTVTLGTVFLGALAAVTGVFAFLRKRSLIGDAVAHAVLPGIAMAFMLTGQKSPWVLAIGALLAGWLSLISVDYLSNKTKLKTDTAIALVLSVFFGVGILLLTHIQHSGAGNQAGLDKFLFGKAASLSRDDVLTFGVIGLIILTVILLMYKEFKLIAFNPDFARAVGLPVKTVEFVLSTLTVLAIITGIQTVGLVLMAALLITPAAAARSWTHRLGAMIALSAFFGALSGGVGVYISYLLPKMPTGPWVVMALSFFALASLAFAPKNGLLAAVLRQRKNREKILTENLLKVFYQLGERAGQNPTQVAKTDIRSHRPFLESELEKGLRKLEKRLLILPAKGTFTLTREGFQEAARVVRLHRLWELYLTQRVNLKDDHIHPNAETIEHIITPELEQELLQELGFPQLDPHESEIPYEGSGIKNG